MIKDFKALKITLASPQQILSWSHGEVKKAETINYRTQKAELDGLMCEKIFGPTRNFECYCGKYKKIRYKGIICDKCGVEVTHKRVRRERMGHIKLASPVVHVWFAYGTSPHKLSMVLDIPQKKLESVIYFARYLITQVDKDKKLEAKVKVEKELQLELDKIEEDMNNEQKQIQANYKAGSAKLSKDEKKMLQFKALEADFKKKSASARESAAKKEEKIRLKYNEKLELINNIIEGEVISEEQHTLLEESDVMFYNIQMGAEAIEYQLKRINLLTEIEKIQNELSVTKSDARKARLVQRLRIMSGMQRNNTSPEWLVMHVIPVLPPDLRPIIQLPGGRFATSDLNDLYRRVINRNNRLKRLIDLGAPEIILRNEKRMLQEAVDALVDNSHRPGKAILNSREHPYKSLADMLRGKQGRFRQNLLGKRVDYSGRAVIVAGPELGIYECGIPKVMALELFKPFVIHEIIVRGLAPNIKSAKNYLEEASSEVWDILEQVTKGRPVLLNRAPTLHKQGIQAFYPRLTEGNAIRVHPSVCVGFNADFDGDQMAVHVPISINAVEEAINRMMPDSNVLLLRDGSPVIEISKDMAFGCYFLTGEEIQKKDTPIRYFGGKEEMIGAYENDEISLRALGKVIYENEVITTTAGRLIFSEALPEDYKFFNKQIRKTDISAILADIFEKYDAKVTVGVIDNLKNLGFKYATMSGFSMSIGDFPISDAREKALVEVDKQIERLNEDYYNGLITIEEKRSLAEDLWMKVSEDVALQTEQEYKDGYVYTLEDSGAYPVKNPIRHIAAIRGLILDPSGKIVELPLRSNYRLGLTSLEYFVAARGTRKALSDVALKTSGSGYLTRKLVDVAQDVITREDDCGTKNGILISANDNRRLAFVKRITGRTLAKKLVHPKSGKVLVEENEIITKEKAEELVNQEVNEVIVRSPITCEAREGICRMCYGYNLGTRKLVDIGTAVGVIAAQAMGEAATQLTLHSKHRSGSAASEDITRGLPRVEELFEARVPKGKAKLAEIEGKVEVVIDDDGRAVEIIVSKIKTKNKEYELGPKDKLAVKKSKKVKIGELLFTDSEGKDVIAPMDGKVIIKSKVLTFEAAEKVSATYKVDQNDRVLVKTGDNVLKGTPLTAGSADPKEMMKLLDLETSQKYLIDNVQATYGLQGIAIDDKHVEVIVKRMSGFVRVRKPGDSTFLYGDYALYNDVIKINADLKSQGKELVIYDRILMGITASAINTTSFLSAASFQEVVRVLSDAALVGKLDYLRGLKENVIIGRPVPLGQHLR